MSRGTKTETKPWQKPELVILTRGNPEEAVLTGCKTGASAGSNGPGYTHACCIRDLPCHLCSDSTSS
jgi:hypothetical protein